MSFLKEVKKIWENKFTHVNLRTPKTKLFGTMKYVTGDVTMKTKHMVCFGEHH